MCMWTYICAGGPIYVREGLYVCGRACMCAGVLACVRVGLYVCERACMCVRGPVCSCLIGVSENIGV